MMTASAAAYRATCGDRFHVFARSGLLVTELLFSLFCLRTLLILLQPYSFLNRLLHCLMTDLMFSRAGNQYCLVYSATHMVNFITALATSTGSSVEFNRD